jgi:hypothetical protein
VVRWLSILVVALALVAAGCGGGDDESSASGDTTTTETVAEETTTDETTTDAGETDLSAILGDEDCAALVAAGASFAQAFSGTSDAEQTKALAELAEKVPDEIKADVQAIADWYAEYAAKLKDIGIEAGKTPSAQQLAQLQTALTSTDSGELTAASERLNAWSEENCSAVGG